MSPHGTWNSGEGVLVGVPLSSAGTLGPCCKERAHVFRTLREQKEYQFLPFWVLDLGRKHFFKSMTTDIFIILCHGTLCLRNGKCYPWRVRLQVRPGVRKESLSPLTSPRECSPDLLKCHTAPRISAGMASVIAVTQDISTKRDNIDTKPVIQRKMNF